jgi:hypothetical protein
VQNTYLTRYSGLCATVGGLILIAVALEHSALPLGCIGDQCLTHPMRDSSPSEAVLFFSSWVLLALSVSGSSS